LRLACGNFQHKPDGVCDITDDFKLFMYPLADHPIEREIERMPQDFSLFGLDRIIRQIDARGVKANLARIDQFPRHAVDIEAIKADKARIKCIYPLIPVWIDLALLICHHERASLTDGDTR
jgi:hypothetical protein